MLSVILPLKRIAKRGLGRHYHPLRSQLIKPISLWRAQKLKGFRNRCKLPFSYRGISFTIVLDPANGYVDEEIFYKGVYETDILDLYLSELRDGDTFVDIGANIGEHSLFASKMVGAKGQVIAFEPVLGVRDQLCESVAVNGFSNITVFPYACGRERQLLPIFKRKGNAGASSLLSSFSAHATETEAVSVIEADDVLAELPRVDFVKIDAEGYEMEVLMGLEKTISKFRPQILFEYSPMIYTKEISSEPHTGTKIMKILARHGYTVTDMEFFSDMTDPIAWSKTFKKVQTTLRCVPNKAAAETTAV
jgi:FkbM family methyltransferase